MTTTAPTTGTTVLTEYAEKTLKKRELEAQVKTLNTELEELEKRSLAALIDMGLTNVKLASGDTVYLDKTIWASLIDDENGTKDGAHMALKRAKLGYLVKNNVNVQTLSAYVRERLNDGKELFPSIVPWINVTEKPAVRVRKGS